MKKKAAGFHITTPEVRTIYLGGGSKQKARYIKLTDGFGKDQLTEDIKAGAAVYKSFEETLKLKNTRYNVITAPTEEDGLRAVAYLAGIYAQQNGYTGQEMEDDFDADEYSEKFDFEGSVLFDDEEEEPYENFAEYEESFDRIPVLELQEVWAQDNNTNPQFGFGHLNVEMLPGVNKTKPWWVDCTEKSVCIVCNRTYEMWPEPGYECLKRFSQNEQVYVLIVSDKDDPTDYLVTKIMLEYTANHYRIDSRKDAVSKYYRALFAEEARRHGFTFEKSIDLPLLTEKLSSMDRQHPCDMFRKIMDYLIHIDADKTLKAGDFDRLGLDRLINRNGNDEKGNLEKDLVGMEGVKKQVNNILNMLRYVKMRVRRDIKAGGYHNVHLFIGAPGTAKTTVARMMAKAMQDEGLITGGRFISVTGAQLKGEFVGQTAPKVHALFEQYDAIFIDEAYSLASSDMGGIDSYSQEALAQLAVELENHATDKLVIFAGYGGKEVSAKNNLMKKFLKSNPGISSRINSTIYFDSYTPGNMVDIVHRLAELSSLQLPCEQDRMISDFFESRIHADDFGNGREARVFLEQCERSIAERISAMDTDKVRDEDLNTVTGDDIRNAIEALTTRRRNLQGSGSFGFA